MFHVFISDYNVVCVWPIWRLELAMYAPLYMFETDVCQFDIVFGAHF